MSSDPHPNRARLGWSAMAALEAEFSGCEAAEVLRRATERFGDRLLVATSFGAEDVVLMEMVASLERRPRVFTLDTGRLPAETHEVMRRTRERWGVEIEVWSPDPAAVEDLVRRKGLDSMYESVESREECCRIRKLEPLGRALATADAWVTGIRREQSPTRAGARLVEFDLTNGGVPKFNPLVDWTEEQVWARIRERNIPFNDLHSRGYPSIGCAPCTRAISPGEDVRAGRWWWEQPEHRECGLHRRPGSRGETAA